MEVIFHFQTERQMLMKTEKEHELMNEWRAARRALREAQAVVDERKADLEKARVDRNKVQRLVTELQDEMDGDTGRDIIDKVGTVHTSENANGTVAHDPAATKAKFQQDGLDDLLHASSTGNSIDGKHRRRKGASIV